MLLNRSRAVTSNSNSNSKSKEALMTDHNPQNYTKPLPYFLVSPRFKPFTFKGMPEYEPVISPTSILELFSPKNTFCSKLPKYFPENKHSWQKIDSKGIGVALVCEPDDERTSQKKSSTSTNKMVLFGTKLKVEIPDCTVAASDSPKSPSDFGIKTRNPQFSRSGFGNSDNQRNFSPVSMRDLELSEDYTCVISYGPNPKTTHIYHNCVLDNCCSVSKKSFLSFCHTCEKKLDQKNDIFIYRGDEAFCSQECRFRKMLLDDETES